MPAFPFTVSHTSGHARRGQLLTSRGAIETPAFMPVGTAATVKGLMPDQVAATGAHIILGNTYHLMLRPGPERVARLGGLHAFMGWSGPILTDSGGFQVWSLGKLAKLTEQGVTFQSHIDGSSHALSPERAIEIQADLLGADISMQLDECTEFPCSHARAKSSMELSRRWAARCKTAFGSRTTQALFGIVQGGTFRDLRAESAKGLVDLGLDGYAIGGLAVGEGHDAMVETLDFVTPLLPSDRPRYLMGVGKPIDLVAAVAKGVDMFDCVLPTRAGRHGQAWTDDGPINIRNARFAEDLSPLAADIQVPASQSFSRAYLHHLFKADEILGQILLSWHNIAYYQHLMQRIRASIADGSFADLHDDLTSRWAATKSKPGKAN